MAGPVGRAAAVLLALVLISASALAQPFAAGGGFDRPWKVAESSSSMRFAFAAGEQGPVVFWSDGQGILSRNVSSRADAVRIVEARGIRELTAGQVAGSTALAWAERDLATGRTGHWLRWRGEDRLLLEALQNYEMSILPSPGGPSVLLARYEESDTVLRLFRWDRSTAPLYHTDLSLVRYSGAVDDGGTAHLVWLEGYRDRTAVGVPADEWAAYHAKLDPDGELPAPIELGPAAFHGASSQTAIEARDGQASALWPGPHSSVLFSGTGSGLTALGQGSVVGLSKGMAFWAEDTAIRARQPGGEDGRLNIAWSPVTIERGELTSAGGATFLAWYGPTRGGGNAIYASDDRRPLRPSLRDRVAAVMGWSPWTFWEALLGQLLGSMLAALLTSMALFPLVWLGGVVLTRFPLVGRASMAGIALGSVTLLLPIIAMRATLPAGALGALFGSGLQLLGSTVLSGALTWLAWRRADGEPLMAVLGSAWMFLFLTSSILIFLTFEAWPGFFWAAG